MIEAYNTVVCEIKTAQWKLMLLISNCRREMDCRITSDNTCPSYLYLYTVTSV